MKPHRRQIRLQCDAMMSPPHISQCGSPPSRGRKSPGRTDSRTLRRTYGTGGKTRPSVLTCINTSVTGASVCTASSVVFMIIAVLVCDAMFPPLFLN